MRAHVRHNAVAYLALFVALGGTGAFAATQLVGPAGQVNGCVTKKGKRAGSLRVVAPGKHCKRTEQAIAWNQRGPVGEPGSPGSPDAPSQVLDKLRQAAGAGSFFQRRGSSTACTGTDKVTGVGDSGDVTCAGDATAPSGTAGGHLAGSYPNPTLAPFPQITVFGVHDCNSDNDNLIINTNTETSLVFRTEQSQSWPASSMDPCVGTQILEVPRTGNYLITAGILWPANGTGSRGLAIALNGGDQVASQRGPAAGTGDTHTNVTALVRLIAGTRIEVKAYQTTGVPVVLFSADRRDFVSVIWLGPH